MGPATVRPISTIVSNVCLVPYDVNRAQLSFGVLFKQNLSGHP